MPPGQRRLGRGAGLRLHHPDGAGHPCGPRRVRAVLLRQPQPGDEERQGRAQEAGALQRLAPFGVKKNGRAIPVPDPATYPGLLLAFEAAAAGKSDREVATLLNDRGYRTTGNRGSNPFSKDTVRPLLQNRFYLGELPDGEGGWVDGAHEALLDDALFTAAQESRQRRASNPLPVQRGTLHIHQDHGRARAYCYRDRQAARCGQRSTFLSVYEEQIAAHLATFTIPVDYRDQLLAAQASLHTAADETTAQRKRLETQRANALVLFELGDMSKADYLARRERL